ncbi:MAG: ankyrin repeat domain-containing protein [Bacteroidales bacterium]
MIPDRLKTAGNRLILIFLVALACRYSYAQTRTDNQYLDMSYDLRLLYSAAFGDTLLIGSLLAAGTDIDVQADNGVTPLAYAVSYDQPIATEYLLQAGADTEISNYRKETPLHLAVFNQNLSIAEILIRYGANIDARDMHGATPLHYAALFGYFYEADMLLYYDALYDIKALDGTTPLMAAVISGNFDIADILLQEGANVNSKDNGGYSPLLIAAQNGDTIMSELLLLNGADLYAVANDGYNALTISIRDGYPGLFNLLTAKGNLWPETKGVNPWLVLEQYRRKDFIKLLTLNNIRKPSNDFLTYLSGEVSLLASGHQLFSGAAIQGRESISGMGFTLGAYFKPLKTRILIQNDFENFSQYKDQRGIIYGGVFRDFILNDTNPLRVWLLSITGKAGYRFGNSYPGSPLKPEQGFIFIPSVSLSLEFYNTAFSMGTEYMKTEVYRSGPLWFRAGFYYKYHPNNVKSKGKIIRWY